MTYFKFFQATLVSISIFIIGVTSSVAMEDSDKALHSLVPSKQIPDVISSPPSVHPDIYEYEEGRSYGHVPIRVDALPNEILYNVLYFLDKSSLGCLSCVNRRFYQLTGDNNLWAQHLTKDKLISLFGRAWDTYPSQIVSYKSYYAVLHLLQDLPKGGEEPIERHLHLAILPNSIFSHQCLGLLYEILGQKAKAFKCFYKAGVLGDELSQKLIVDSLCECHESAEERYQKLLSLAEKGWKKAQDVVVEALYKGKFDLGKRTEEESYQTLLSLAEKGWKAAQSTVVDILYEGRFGQNQTFAEERYQKLFTWAESGWYSAQMKVASALYGGRLGQNKRCEEDRYKELEYLAESGWEEAKRMIIDALRGREGTLGQNKKSEKKRYQELLSLGEKGWEDAQYWVMLSIIDGYLDWDKRSGEERYQELFSLAEKKWRVRESDSAQLKVANALYEGTLGQNKRPAEERYQELLSLAKLSWDGAQEKVAEALYEGTLGQNKRSEEDRYEELENLAEIGWVSAQEKVAKALYKGTLGQNKKPAEERYQEFLSLAERSSPVGAWEVVQILCNGELGQGKRPTKERYQELVSLGDRGWGWAKSKAISTIIGSSYSSCSSWGSEKEQYEELVSLAERGWEDAQIEVCNAHNFNMVGGHTAVTSGSVYALLLFPGKSRDLAPPYFKKYKNARYFQLFRTLVEGTFKAKEHIIEP